MARNTYNASFYHTYLAGALASAEELVPYILRLSRARSVVDVGCGTGIWLEVYRRNGIEDYLGLDGSWINPKELCISPQHFTAVDLAVMHAPERTFDVAQALEVAEHLPTQVAAKFVRCLTRLSNVVVFSAAIPHQGGAQHQNERWHGYWRDRFEAHDFALYDAFRPTFWENPRVDWWYAQNMFLYVKRGECRELTTALGLAEGWSYPERIVHPGRLDPARNVPLSIRGHIRALPRAFVYALGRRLAARRTSPSGGRRSEPSR